MAQDTEFFDKKEYSPSEMAASIRKFKNYLSAASQTSANNVFVAEYNVTTKEELESAYNAGKVLALRRPATGGFYVFSGTYWYSGEFGEEFLVGYRFARIVLSEERCWVEECRLGDRWMGITLEYENSNTYITELQDQIDKLQEQLDNSQYVTTKELPWAQGTISLSGTPDTVNSTSKSKSTRIRTLKFVPVAENGQFNLKDGYKFSYRVYSDDGTFLETSDWIEASYSYTFDTSKRYRLVAARDDGMPILPSESPVTITYTMLRDPIAEREIYSRVERDPICQSRYSDSDGKSLTILHFSDLHSSLYSMQDLDAFYKRNRSLIDVPLNTGDLVLTSARVKGPASMTVDNNYSSSAVHEVGNLQAWGEYLYRIKTSYVGNFDIAKCDFFGYAAYNDGNKDVPWPDYPGSNRNFLRTWYKSEIGKKSLFAVGNHDTNIKRVALDGTATNEWTALNSNETFAEYLQYVWENLGAVGPTGKCYYYKDFTGQKLRLIVLDFQHWDATELEWFETILENSKVSDYGVIVAAHYVPGTVKGYTETNFTSFIYPDSSYSGGGTYVNDAVIPSISRFIDDGGEFVCWLSGHVHRDRFAYSVIDPRITVIAVQNAGNFNSSLHEGERADSSIHSRTCANIVTINRTDKLIKIVRFGNDMDAQMRKKSYLCFDYANRKFISMNGESPISIASAELTNLQQQIDDLAYKPIEILSLTISPSSAVKGNTVDNVTCSYSLNKVPATLTLNNTDFSSPEAIGIITLDQQGITKDNYADRPFILTANDAGSPSNLPTTVTKSIIIPFYNYIYWGAAAIPEIVDRAFLERLTGTDGHAALNDTISRSITVRASSNQYIWYAYPARLGYVTFKIGGFDGGFEAPTIVSVTNTFNFTEDYYIYRSTNPNLGYSKVDINYS